MAEYLGSPTPIRRQGIPVWKRRSRTFASRRDPGHSIPSLGPRCALGGRSCRRTPLGSELRLDYLSYPQRAGDLTDALWLMRLSYLRYALKRTGILDHCWSTKARNCTWARAFNPCWKSSCPPAARVSANFSVTVSSNEASPHLDLRIFDSAIANTRCQPPLGDKRALLATCSLLSRPDLLS